MELVVDQLKATRVLRDSLMRSKDDPSLTCVAKPAVDFILAGDRCLTYRYILLTALTAKATNASIDILSLQVSDSSSGAYDARSLCSNVVFPFQREFLDDILDGSNEDPLVNNPGRNPRIQENNKAASGDPRKALNLLCEYLPLIASADDAGKCLDYFISQCLGLIQTKQEQSKAFSSAVINSDIFSAKTFMSDLLDTSFGGAALLLVATSIFSVLYPRADGYNVVSHPVNQPGSASSQMGDLDIFTLEKNPFLAIELKDKPFSQIEVAKAAKTAFEHGVPSMLFIAGRSSHLTDEIYRYFNEVKKEYADKKMMIGVVSIDSLLDLFFSTHYKMDMPFIFESLDKTVVDAKVSPEIQRWIFRRVEALPIGKT